MPARCRHHGGFSLIELMVSVAIVALLASILLPSLSHARARAREVACATSLRTWGQAFHLYANDQNDRGRNRPPDQVDPAHPEHECCYIDVLPPLTGRRAWRDFADGEKPTGDIWQCLEACPLPDAAYSPQYRPSTMGYHSYAMNSYLERDFQYGLGPGEVPQPSFLQLSLCRAPSRTILMFEQTLDPSQGSGQQGGLTQAGRFTAEDPRALTERHTHIRGRLGGNLMMIDAHVEWCNNLWDPSLPDPRVPSRGDLTWYPY
jgi:prepilin-type N-terminal cleavage/methylation domain-containing protein